MMPLKCKLGADCLVKELGSGSETLRYALVQILYLCVALGELLQELGTILATPYA